MYNATDASGVINKLKYKLRMYRIVYSLLEIECWTLEFNHYALTIMHYALKLDVDLFVPCEDTYTILDVSVVLWSVMCIAALQGCLLVIAL